MDVYEEDYRLPTNVRPTHYDLTVKTDLKLLRFDGIVRIWLNVIEDTSAIILNSSDHEIGSATLQCDALLTAQSPTSQTIDTTHERAVFLFSIPLPAGSKAQLTLTFTGALTDSLCGYYRSISASEDLSTPVAARKAFPCWDEPLLKASFTISLVSRADTVNLSNMSVASEIVLSHGAAISTSAGFDTAWISEKLLTDGTANADKWKVTRFETSPLMSTYFVAYANGEFSYLESSYTSPLSGRTRSVRVYATRDIVHQAQFVLDLTVKVIPLYEKVFDIEYPLPKLDTLVASVPYLSDPYAYAKGVFPEWKLHSTFISTFLQSALLLDARLSSHAIEVPYPDANMIGQIFDALSYEKAASVLRMLSHYVGEEHFLRGVSMYLKSHLYGNSVTEDLWEGISTATGLDINKMMNNWVKEMGFPVVTVTETHNGIHVRQDRFLASGLAEPDENDTIWTIPLFLLTVSADGTVSVDEEIVLDEREKIIALDITKPFKLNAGTLGFYRVLYSPDRLVQMALEAVKPSSPFSTEDRMGIIYDAVALSRAGLIDVSSALSSIYVFRNETDYLVLEGISSCLYQLISVWWEYPLIVDSLNELRREIFSPIVQYLGYDYMETELLDIHQLRTLAISHAAAAGDQEVIQTSINWFARYMQSGDDSHIRGDLEAVVFATAVEYGSHTEWEAVKQISLKPKSPSSGMAAMRAMCATQDLALARETVNYAFHKARDQDITYCFAGLEKNFKTRKLLATAFMENFSNVHNKFASSYMFRFLIESAFGSLSSRQDYNDIDAFFRDKDVSKISLQLKQNLDNIQSNAAWVERSTADLRQWFLERK
uniref:Aminopeptidase n=1 Tax=Fibroporia radiculosa TaxID=599839 RepID=J4H4P2_9APHY|nr:uncharacterized protein FIBRA_07548 [Fibroporia radiculosa]CCM05334.1 predicted protein [Fibroporia radiculosa]